MAYERALGGAANRNVGGKVGFENTRKLFNKGCFNKEQNFHRSSAEAPAHFALRFGKVRKNKMAM